MTCPNSAISDVRKLRTSGGKVVHFMIDASAVNMRIGRSLSLIFLIFISAVVVLSFSSLSIAVTDAQIIELINQSATQKSTVGQLQVGQQAALDRLHTTIGKLNGFVLAVNPSSGSLITGGYVTAKRGTSIDFPITLLGGSPSPAGFQGNFIIPPGFTLTSVVAGPTAIAAGKSVSFNTVGGTSQFIVFGLNQNVIASGVVAIAKFSVASSANQGFATVSIVSPVASDLNGNGLPISNVSGIVKVTP